MNEHVCDEKRAAELIQSGYQVTWTIFEENGIFYLLVNNEYEIPIRACPFCQQKYKYGRIKK